MEASFQQLLKLFQTAFKSYRLSYKEHGADALALRADEGRDKLR